MHRKQLVDIFCEKLKDNFEKYCIRFEKDSKMEEFITYLVDQEIIANTVVHHFAILEVFEDLYESNGGHKTQAVNEIAERFNLSNRNVWNILRKRKK